ncbi:hypothetical protein TCE0_034r11823 [Talaromyces pinophilus]|uniref:CBM1 domain-containing protein n=1 Tax=Talaromyces pinophilus TaxID=128442 RepID=A0A6V8HEZ1_TALPI|nr:Multidomain esterase [Talaromyces pinophilus]GAM39901.1 hypothetical protein TCE0_034r11823 [Talaromyces pinophilus]
MVINSLASALLALTLPIILPTAAQTTVRYMPLGDSITEITCWRSLLWTQLQETGYQNVNFVGSMTTENPAGCSIENYNHHSEGHQGYSAVGIVNGNDLVGWLNNNPADVITMHLGTNDIFGGQTTQQILGAFTTLVQQMRNSNPRMKIIVAQILPIFVGSDNTQVQALNSAIPSWAASQNTTQSPIWVVDQYDGVSPSDLRDDVHPNSSGDSKMAAKWYPAVVDAVNTVLGATMTTQSLYGQCGGVGWTGPTVCTSPYTCTVGNEYYSQCL